jgi:hypothetical protein
LPVNRPLIRIVLMSIKQFCNSWSERVLASCCWRLFVANSP